MRSDRYDLAKKLMAVLEQEGLQAKFVGGDLDDSADVLEDIIDAFTFVQARLVATYLVKLAQDGTPKDTVLATADDIVKEVSEFFDQAVTHELRAISEQLKILVNKKGTTSH